MSWKRYDSRYQAELKKEFDENSQYEWTEKKNGQPEAVIHSNESFNDHVYSTVKMHCAFCGKEMYAAIASYNQGLKYCSDHCASKAGVKVISEKNRLLRDKTCPVCGKEFTAARRDALYCSKACKQMAYRKGIKSGDASDSASEPEQSTPRSKTITLGNTQLYCLELDNEWWYYAEPITSSLRLLSTERDIREYVDDADYKKVVFGNNTEKAFSYVNTSGLTSLLLACRLPEAKTFRKAVLSKALMKPGRSGSPTEWTEADKQLADPDYPLQVLMQIIEAQEKRISDNKS